MLLYEVKVGRRGGAIGWATATWSATNASTRAAIVGMRNVMIGSGARRALPRSDAACPHHTPTAPGEVLPTTSAAASPRGQARRRRRAITRDAEAASRVQPDRPLRDDRDEGLHPAAA